MNFINNSSSYKEKLLHQLKTNIRKRNLRTIFEYHDYWFIIAFKLFFFNKTTIVWRYVRSETSDLRLDSLSCSAFGLYICIIFTFLYLYIIYKTSLSLRSISIFFFCEYRYLYIIMIIYYVMGTKAILHILTSHFLDVIICFIEYKLL